MPTVASTQQFTASLTGGAGAEGVNDTFSTIRSAAGTSTGTFIADLNASATSNQFQALIRGIFLFDTSALPANATITSATITLVPVSLETSLGSTSIQVVSSNPASNTSIAAGDYNSLGSTSFASVNQSSLTVGASSILTLNSSGLSNISLSGFSKFGLLLGWDLTGSFSGTWVSDASTYAKFDTAPILSVTYTQPTLTIQGISSITGASSISFS